MKCYRIDPVCVCVRSRAYLCACVRVGGCVHAFVWVYMYACVCMCCMLYLCACVCMNNLGDPDKNGCEIQ